MAKPPENALERAAVGSAWIEELLALFFAVDEAKADALALPDGVLVAYERAEKARQEL